MSEKKEIEAVHQLDIKSLLDNFGLLDDFKEKKIKCHFCKDVIGEDNFGAVYSKSKKILFSCSKLECLANLTK